MKRECPHPHASRKVPTAIGTRANPAGRLRCQRAQDPVADRISKPGPHQHVTCRAATAGVRFRLCLRCRPRAALAASEMAGWVSPRPSMSTGSRGLTGLVEAGGGCCGPPQPHGVRRGIAHGRFPSPPVGGCCSVLIYPLVVQFERCFYARRADRVGSPFCAFPSAL